MTPLEQARQQQKKGCDTCAKRVVLRPNGASYCKVSGKLLLPSLMDCGQCAHVPSEYEPKGDDMETRENELHEPRVIFTPAQKWSLSHGRKVCPVCGLYLVGMVNCTEQETMALSTHNYCPNCGARLKEVDK